MADRRIARVRRLTRRLAAIGETQVDVAEERRELVRELLADGWSMSTLAAEVDLTKAAVQKIAR